MAENSIEYVQMSAPVFLTYSLLVLAMGYMIGWTLRSRHEENTGSKL
jgi:hypothetical protein